MEVVYACFNIQPFRASSDPLLKTAAYRSMSYFIVLNITNQFSKPAQVGTVKVTVASDIAIESASSGDYSVETQSSLVEDIRACGVGVETASPFWLEQDRSRLIGLSGIRQIPDDVLELLSSGSLPILGEVSCTAENTRLMAYSLSRVHLEHAENEYIYNHLVSDIQFLKQTTNPPGSLEVTVQPRG
ncbi:MAG: hypothetical protein ACE14S_11060 [Candidatus Bathyarchaeia archaeon]